ncbi:hypothetical protein Q5P01_005381 [Channa striata]|uniref:Uncharacterized protein n=1 Tax=Channa striata TaxID=64152 RepID=A0AA88T306_CHASR|nr:hypothetical protein Q5P01_005381 [Channa striata]
MCFPYKRSLLPTVDLAPVPVPVALFLPLLRSPTLAGRVQGISPSVLGVPLYSHTDGDSGSLHVKHHTGLITSCDFMLHMADFYLHVPRVSKQNRGC